MGKQKVHALSTVYRNRAKQVTTGEMNVSRLAMSPINVYIKLKHTC